MDPEELKKTYDAIADHWDATRTRPWPETLEFLEKGGKGKKLLDIGCGTGRNAEYALKKGWKVMAVDYSAGQLEVARRRVGDGVEFVLADARNLPFDDKSFDAFISIAVIHHFPDRSDRLKALQEARRVLKKGGEGLVSGWSQEHEKFRECQSKDILVPWHRTDGKVFQRFYHLFDQEELENLCLEAGFTLIEGRKGAGNNHAWVKKS